MTTRAWMRWNLMMMLILVIDMQCWCLHAWRSCCCTEDTTSSLSRMPLPPGHGAAATARCYLALQATPHARCRRSVEFLLPRLRPSASVLMQPPHATCLCARLTPVDGRACQTWSLGQACRAGQRFRASWRGRSRTAMLVRWAPAPACQSAICLLLDCKRPSVT